MKRRTCYLAAGALAGLFVAAGSIEFADSAHSLPLMQHTGAGGFTNAHCLDSGAWAATLSITGTNLDLHPKATISVGGQPPMNPVDVPYGHAFTAPASQASLSASAHIVWDDGVTQDVGPYIASRPDGCTPPTTAVGVTTTTTCAQAIPPRDDCEVTTSPPTTAASDTPTSTTPSLVTAPSATTEPVAISISRPANGISETTTRQPISLPTTGGNDTTVIVAGIGAVLIGGVLLLAGRRGAS